MPAMHPGQPETSADLVRALLRDQLPHLADLQVTPVAEAGTDHDLYRLGTDLVVRLPVVPSGEEQVVSDAERLTVLAPHLPVEVPRQVARGRPGHGFPYAWSVVRWVEGEGPDGGNWDDRVDQLSAFVRALHGVATDEAPRARPGQRGYPLECLDEPVEHSLEVLGDRVDQVAVRALWDDCRSAPVYDGPPVWLHADLQAGNLVVRDRRLAGVIDFGVLVAGDPAADLLPAWSLFAGDERASYLHALGYDDATTRRARGWALAPSLSGLHYYEHTRPDLAAESRRRIDALLDDLLDDLS